MFEFTSKAKSVAMALVILGIIGVIAGFMTNGSSHDDHGHDHMLQKCMQPIIAIDG